MTQESEKMVRPFNLANTPVREDNPTNVATQMSRKSIKKFYIP